MLGCDPVRRQDEETLGGGGEPSCVCVRGGQQCSLPRGKAGEPGAGVLLGPSGQSEGGGGLEWRGWAQPQCREGVAAA